MQDSYVSSNRNSFVMKSAVLFGTSPIFCASNPTLKLKAWTIVIAPYGRLASCYHLHRNPNGHWASLPGGRKQKSKRRKPFPTPHCFRSCLCRHRLRAPFTQSRALRRHRFAQANSVASIANPRGIMINAGPGKTTIAKPSNNTVAPTIAMTTRFSRGESPLSRKIRRNLFQELLATARLMTQ